METNYTISGVHGKDLPNNDVQINIQCKRRGLFGIRIDRDSECLNDLRAAAAPPPPPPAPDPEPAPVPQGGGADPNPNWSKDQLKAYCGQHNIEYDNRWGASKLLSAIADSRELL